jgi:hypothetical protein
MTKKKLFNKDSGRARRFFTSRAKKKPTNSVNETPVPRITTETVSEHREQVISGARKYKYPLQHSRHKIVIVSVSILVVIFIGFMTFTLLSLYKYQNTSAFMYQVTKIVPLPIARVGGVFVPYEDYLFELRHYIHYFETQQEVDFKSDEGKGQLIEQQKKSLESVVDNAIIKKIAREKNITVSSEEVDNQINLLRDQNRLGSDNKVFENVLSDYWGWSVNDFKRSIKQELLRSKVTGALDTETNDRASRVLAELQAGKDFASSAKENSDDATTKDRGGELGFLISKSDRNIPPQTIDALSKLKPGEISGIINLGYGLEIVKNLGVEGDKTKASRIFFNYKDISTYLNDNKAKNPPKVYIKVN